MEGRLRVRGVLRACAAGAVLAGALAAACNSLSGIGDFAVGPADEAGMGPPDVAMAEGSAGRGEAAADGGGPDADARTGGDADATAPSDGPTSGDAVPEAGDAGQEEAPHREAAPGDGPEEAQPDAGGGAGPCEGGALVAHTNGLGQTFSDCAPLGTFDQTQAFEACSAHAGDAGACTVDPVTCGGGDDVCVVGATSCACWRYNGSNAGHVNNVASACTCLGASSPTWN